MCSAIQVQVGLQTQPPDANKRTSKEGMVLNGKSKYRSMNFSCKISVAISYMMCSINVEEMRAAALAFLPHEPKKLAQGSDAVRIPVKRSRGGL